MRLTCLCVGLAIFSFLSFHPDLPCFDNSAHAATASTAEASSTSNNDHMSVDPRVAEARALFNGKKFGEALAILRQIEFGRRNWKDIQFLRGMAAVESGIRTEPGDQRDALLAEAVTAFRRISDTDPELTRVRLELARTLYMQQDDVAAEEHFERVMVSDVHPNMKANAQRFLDSIHGRRSLKWSFGMGITRDTNIESMSTERIVEFARPLGQFSLKQLEFNLPEVDSGLGVSTSIGFVHSKFESGKWVYRGDIFRSEYKGRKYDRMVLSGSAGPRWFFNGGRQRLSISGTLRRDWTGNDIPLFFEYGGRIQTTQFVGSDWQFTQSLSISQQQFRKKFRRNTAGVLSLDSDAYYRLNDTTQVNFGASTGWSRPRNRLARNRSYSARAGVSRDFGWGMTLGARLSYKKTSYWGSGGLITKDLKKRTDKQTSVQLLVNKRDFQIKGFSPQLVFSRNKLDTNAPARSYKRKLVEIRVNRQL